MRKLFWQMMMSLDGYMEGPNKELDWHVVDDEFLTYAVDMLRSVDTILFGRVTYQMMAAFWPSAKSPEAPMMNELPKVVFSRTLDKVEWKNARLVKGSIEDEVTRLKKQPGKDIVLLGSSDLASTLFRLRLIDEVRVFVNPVVIGKGNPMFRDVRKIPMQLLKARQFGSGNVLLCYRPLYDEATLPKGSH